MRLKAFTIVELIIAVIIVGILGTLAINQYQGFVENADAQVCETNLKTLQNSMESYSLEHDTIPAAVSEIPEKYIEKAFASIMRQKGSWKIKLAYLVVDWKHRGFFQTVVYAQSLNRLNDLAKGNSGLLRCPKVPIGQNSYGINSVIKGHRSVYYRKMKRLYPNLVLISDSDAAEMSGDPITATAQLRHYRALSGTGGYNCGVTISGKTLIDLGKEFKVMGTYNPKHDFAGFINALKTGHQHNLQVGVPSGSEAWPEFYN
jgi:type II secretory pathway pseudopilin PulG